MGTLSRGRLWLHRSPHLLLVILIGVLFTASTLGQFQRNTVSRNVWRRQPVEEPAPAYLQTNTDSRTVLRRQSPPDDDAPPLNAPPSPTKDILPSASVAQHKFIGGPASAQQGRAPGPPPPGPPGKCWHCTRTRSGSGGGPNDDDCIEKAPSDDPASTHPAFPVECEDTTDKNVRCVTFHMVNKGTREKSKNKLTADQRKGMRLEGRTCMNLELGALYQGEPVDECALEYLNLKLEDGKCIKGSYLIDELDNFAVCTRWFSNYNIRPDNIKDTQSTAQSKKIEDFALWYGPFGREQYADLTICSCKGEKCNKQTTQDLGKTVEASGAARKFGTGLLRLLTYSTVIQAYLQFRSFV